MNIDRVVQTERAGPITHRLVDRKHSLLRTTLSQELATLICDIGMLYNWLYLNIYIYFFVFSCWLTHFHPIFHFYSPWKHEQASSFLMFSGGIEVEHWLKMGLRLHVILLRGNGTGLGSPMRFGRNPVCKISFINLYSQL